MAVECPTKLFYSDKDKVYRDTSQEDGFLAMLADGGYQVGELAKCYHPEGIEVSDAGHALALAKTNQLLQRDKVTIFEAAVLFGDLFIRIDILKKDGVVGLFGRGLPIRLFTNGIQGVMFSVLWKHFSS